MVGAVQGDELLRESVIARASDGDRIAKTVLTATRIQHADLQTEAQELFSQVMAYKVGEKRDEMVVTDRFRRVAILSAELTPEQRDSLAIHLLEIARDHSSPEPHRAEAAEALAELADKVSESVQRQGFDTLLSLIHSGHQRIQ